MACNAAALRVKGHFKEGFLVGSNIGYMLNGFGIGNEFQVLGYCLFVKPGKGVKPKHNAKQLCQEQVYAMALAAVHFFMAYDALQLAGIKAGRVVNYIIKE